MATRNRLVTAGATLALVLALTLTARPAHAHRRWWSGGGGGWNVGTVVADAIAGVALGARIVTPPVSVEIHAQTYPYYYVPVAPPPPPPPVVVMPPPPPACCYAPPPVVVAPAGPRPEVGLALAGVLQGSQNNTGLPVGGLAASLQFRGSPHTLLALELDTLGAHDLDTDERRTQLDGLVAGRLYLWDAALAPYGELAGGVGRTSLEYGGFADHATQLVGRIGVGLELRLGDHLVLDATIARTGRVRVDNDHGAGETVPYTQSRDAVGVFIDDYEHATEARAGLAFRF